MEAFDFSLGGRFSGVAVLLFDVKCPGFFHVYRQAPVTREQRPDPA